MTEYYGMEAAGLLQAANEVAELRALQAEAKLVAARRVPMDPELRALQAEAKLATARRVIGELQSNVMKLQKIRGLAVTGKTVQSGHILSLLDEDT